MDKKIFTAWRYPVKSIFLVLLICIFALAYHAAAAQVRELPTTRVTVNGVPLALDPQNPAIEVNSRILVPMRIILQALGAEVDWNDATQTVTADLPGYAVVLRIGDNRATINDELQFLDVMPMLYNTRTYLPIRFCGESVGATVDYDAVSGNVTITKAGITVTNPPVTPPGAAPTTPPPSLPAGARNMTITTGFTNGAVIPARFQSSDVDGALEMSPPVSWTAVNGAAGYLVALADISYDEEGYLYWLALVPAETTRIAENAFLNEALPEEAEEIITYNAPYMEPEDNRHDFELLVVALSTWEVDFYAVSDYQELRQEVAPYTLAQGLVSGYINYGKVITPAPARPANLNVTSVAFSVFGIPLKYTDSYTETEEGDGISIPLSWGRGPAGTLSYAFILVDTTSGMDNYVHWMVAGIPATVTSIPEDAYDLDLLPEDSEEVISYEPPYLDVDDGRHTYKLIVVALNDDLDSIEDLDIVYTLEEFESSIAGHVLARGEITSFFQAK